MKKRKRRLPDSAPLYARLRPKSMDDFIGQRHLFGEGAPLRILYETMRVESMVLWGPPGCGKTSFATLFVEHLKMPYLYVSAVELTPSKVNELKKQAEFTFLQSRKPFVCIIDEIHRLNRAEQSLLLPILETGKMLLIGLTTENPGIALIPPLRSRVHIYEFKPLEEEHMRELISRACTMEGFDETLFDQGVVEALIQYSGGDGRRLLILLESLFIENAYRNKEKVREEDLEKWASTIVPRMDLKGEEFYNLISALHKSVRNSDVDASLYWLVRMLDGGADPLYILRRLIRIAAEDIGLAYPQALFTAILALQGYELLGYPEGELLIAQTVIFLALAPKSNAVYRAYSEAKKVSRKFPHAEVPYHLRNPVTQTMKEMGYGEGYVYAHDFEEGTTPMSCLPSELEHMTLYVPTDRGFEKQLRQWLETYKNLREKMKKKE